MSGLGCQLDVTPTILGLIGRPYDSLFFGRDLLADETAEGRVLMHHNRSIGIYRNERLAVFGLNQQQSFWQGRLKGGELNPLAEPDPMARATAREGMALFRVADDLYLQRRYRVSPAVTPSHVVLSP
jgi:arylsulfatase A-like enzyme